MQSLAGGNIKQRLEGIKPSAIYGYVDKLVLWVNGPLTSDEVKYLNQFGHVRADDRSKVRTANYFGQSYRQRRTDCWGDVRFGSKADVRAAKSHVRFTPETGHVRCN